MVKILVIITTAMVPYGGLASVMMNLYRKIDKKKFQIDFASTNEILDEKLYNELEANGSKYYPLGNRKRALLGYINKLSYVIREGKYDVVHVNSNSATALIELEIAKKHGVGKRIVHNHTSICDHKMLHKICYPFFRKSYTDAIACSIKAGKWIFEDGKFQIVNNGIDTERYRFSDIYRTQIRTRYSISESTIVLGHVGKIYKPKNHPFLIDIFSSYHKRNPDSRLLLVGDGVMRKEIEERVLSLGLNEVVIFAGMQRDPEKYLSAMDAFVFPSIWEGMPLSMIEAQASGIPCIASNTIDKGVVVTDYVKRLEIDKGEQVWVEELMNISKIDRNKSSDANIQKIIQAGYDANINAHQLETIYNN